MILVFWMLSFKPASYLSSFTCIKVFFSSSLLSAIRVVSSAYLRLLIFLLAILIPPCASSSPAFLMIYSAYKWNKQGDNIQPWCPAFPIWNQSVIPCPVLTVAPWQISQEAGQVVWYSHLLKNFPQFVVIHTIKGFGVISKAEVDVFLEFSSFFNNPVDVGNSLTPWICSPWSGWMTSPRLNHSCRSGFISSLTRICYLPAFISSSFLP